MLKKRTCKGKQELFVSFMGWPKKFNMWLPAENFKTYKRLCFSETHSFAVWILK